MPKTILFSGFILCMAFLSYSQDIPEANLVVFGRIPLQLLSEGQYIEPLGKHQLKLEPGKLTIQPFRPSGAMIASNFWIPDDNNVHAIEPHGLLMGLYDCDSLLSPWYSFCKHLFNELSDDCTLNEIGLEVWLQDNKQYKLVFLDRADGKEVYCLYLLSENYKAELQGWAETSEKHFEKDSGKARREETHFSHKTNDDKIATILATKPGDVKLSFRKPYPWANSLYEFSWFSSKAKSALDWQQVVNGFSVPVSRQQPGELAVRYGKLGDVKIITLAVKPRWFDPLWVKVFISSLVLLFCISIYYAYIFNKERQKLRCKKQLIRELLSMQHNLTPHFIKNALYTLQNLLDLPDGNRKARQFSIELGDLLRQAIEKRESLYQSLEETCSQLKRFIVLQQLSYGFTSHFEISPSLDLGAIEVPSNIFQPIVENAIQHNLPGKDGSLRVKLNSSGNTLIVAISAQNPIGPIILKPNSTGYRLSWVSHRLDIHNQMFPQRAITYTTQFSTGKSRVVFTFLNHIRHATV